MRQLLKLDKVNVKFGGLKALNDIDLSVNRGEILALIGPNGAGKSTLFNLLTGIYKPTSGTVYYKNQSINRLPPNERVKIGIARTFQNTRLIKSMTVLENLLIAHRQCNTEGVLSSIFFTRKARETRQHAVQECMELLKLVGLAHKLEELAGSLPYGEQRLLEIARALVTKCEVLLMDEPAAGMNQSEKNQLVEKIGYLSSEVNINIILIEHDIGLIMEISDRVIVLDHGYKIAEGTPEEIQNNPIVIKAYLGGGDDLDEQ
ncbi:ABC transporter ATP-binding protein [Paenibacillus sp. R14(2021)]|uniref:ABC transporter ATP-binding protein n=1 Tax=Paenibacillus sp. R14(2021) TaxID=2859228 RepID=UPI001C614D0F|nr:ABC transporter ATP-binding protein [Paenibacillus sp. R14(2021)]